MPWLDLQQDILEDMAEVSMSWAQRENLTSRETRMFHAAAEYGREYRRRPHVAAKERVRKRVEYAANRETYKGRRDRYRKTDHYRRWAHDYYQVYNRQPERRARQNETRRIRMQNPVYREAERKKARAREQRQRERRRLEATQATSNGDPK